MRWFLVFLLSGFTLYADWAEEILRKMTLSEKVGQLFIVPICPNREEDHLRDLERLITEYHIGGILPKQGSLESQVKLINILQSKAKIPLLCVLDAESGLAKRLMGAPEFPSYRTLGKIDDLDLIYSLGYEIGRQCQLVGGHVNLAPVADVDSNPQNPIIGERSFGSNPIRVAEHAAAFIRGMQDSGLLACAKHFPGHGDTSVDSHLDLPRPGSIELGPFARAIEEGVACIMPGHLLVCSIDEEYPSSLSKKILQNLLREEMGFEGLIISDALNMQALERYYSPEEIAFLAFSAGVDLLLYGDICTHVDRILRETVPSAIEVLKEDSALLDERVLKILKIKQALGLHQKRFTDVLLLSNFCVEETMDLQNQLFFD